MEQGRRIPNRLRRHRRISGYTQKEVAQRLGLHCANRLSSWEQGHSLPSLKNILKLSVLYQTLVEELYIDILKESRKELKQTIINKPE